jgi:hypothetical protein
MRRFIDKLLFEAFMASLAGLVVWVILRGILPR